MCKKVIDMYNLHCSMCEYTGYKMIKASEVMVTLDLEDDVYIFEAICPDCRNQIRNTRDMR